MRLSHLFFATLRDDPSEAEMPSHRLLLRAGYMRQLGAGIYSLLPLGFRVNQRVEQGRCEGASSPSRLSRFPFERHIPANSRRVSLRARC